MVTLTVNGTSIDPEDEGTIAQTISALNAKDMAICVQVRVRSEGVDVALATDACGGGGGGRAPNAQEIAIIELWRSHALQSGRFAPGRLISFLKKVT